MILVCFAFLVGYHYVPFHKTMENKALKATTTTFERNDLRTYIGLYQKKLFYMEIDNTLANFYIYNFETSENKKVFTVSNFALKGTSDAYINNSIYFYLSVYNGDDLKNILCVMDFLNDSMKIISENIYSQKLIPLTEYNDNVIALQKNDFNNGSVNSFIELVNYTGKSRKITLKNSDDTEWNSKSRQIIYLDNNGKYLCTIEKEKTNFQEIYYFVKYDSNFKISSEINITNIFIDYEITDNIGMFHAFGDFFCITDYSNNTIICKLENKDVSVILYDADIEYVENSYGYIEFEIFFHRGTNDIYILDIKTGKMCIKTYDLENDTSLIRCVLLYNDCLMIIKKPLSKDDHTEYLYLIS